MPVFTTPSSLRARHSTRTPSLPLHVNTVPAQPTSDADPTSANATGPGSPLPESETIVFKAKRAYDRDRQRAKKRKERADRERERNASLNPVQAVHSREGSGKHSASGGGGGGGGKGATKPRLVTSEDKDVHVAILQTSPVEEIIADVVERTMLARGDGLTASTKSRSQSQSQPLEVSIEQLLKPGKARKSKAGDFEVVSEMPIVIALDDQIPDDAELDEPWEHISADELDEGRASPPSYAAVLANAI